MGALVILTGGSRGFGRALAQAVTGLADNRPAAVATSGSPDAFATRPTTIVLLSRDAAGISSTASNMLRSCEHATVIEHVIDFADLEAIEQRWKEMLSKLGSACFDVAYLFNNAGSLGEIGAIRDTTSLAEMKLAVDVNVTAMMWLTHLFLKFVRSTAIRV